MKTKLHCLTIVAGLLGGCVVQTLQPLFVEKDFVVVPELAGAWEQRDNDKRIGLWVFSTNEGRYLLKHTDEKGNNAVFDVAAGRIGTNIFLDFVLRDLEPAGMLNDLATVSLIGAHGFAKLVKRDGAWVLVAMDYEWLQKHLETNPKAVAHVIQDKRPILTASTAELQQFVARHADDAKVFKNEVRLERKGD